MFKNTINFLKICFWICLSKQYYLLIQEKHMQFGGSKLPFLERSRTFRFQNVLERSKIENLVLVLKRLKNGYWSLKRAL